MNSSIKKQINFKKFIKKKKVGILIITKLGSKRLKDKIKAKKQTKTNNKNKTNKNKTKKTKQKKKMKEI